ncbi:50S ribosomal protein L11 methyltransferase [Thalassobacillus sp. C254]|uniref:50S ribosomal protein L11 methyltransferase n=1 Tax=Thalassobacillus sp. C254 TaxID=1225341 RepID=UPI0006D1A919|nr:50S ribosomal protein L11 methyltransferase [Thalassobacillus sp. C254]
MREWVIPFSFQKEEEVSFQLYEAGFHHFYIEEPIKQIQTEDGYGVEKLEEGTAQLHLFPEDDWSAEEIAAIVGVTVEDIKEKEWKEEQAAYENITLPSGWKVIYPPFPAKKGEKELLLDPQGAFGTGVHGTTQDSLDILMELPLENGRKAADIGTGSGILAVGAAVKGVQVDAFDIQPVQREVTHQAELNHVQERIIVKEQDVLSEDLETYHYDLIIINIGASVTKEWLQSKRVFEKSTCSLYLVSGIVDWSKDGIIALFHDAGFKLCNSRQSEEWHTLLFTDGQGEDVT